MSFDESKRTALLTKKQLHELTAIKKRIESSDAGYIMVKPGAVKVFVMAGILEQNDEIRDAEGNVAVRLAGEHEEEGRVVFEETCNEYEERDNTAVPVPEMSPEVSKSASFVIEDSVPLPSVSGRGRAAGGAYPFDLLKVGQSFFVPNSEKRPNAAKSMASAVSSATARYAVLHPSGETRVNKKGNTVPVTVDTRKFVVRSVEEKGVKGARIWRTE